MTSAWQNAPTTSGPRPARAKAAANAPGSTSRMASASATTPTTMPRSPPAARPVEGPARDALRAPLPSTSSRLETPDGNVGYGAGSGLPFRQQVVDLRHDRRDRILRRLLAEPDVVPGRRERVLDVDVRRRHRERLVGLGRLLPERQGLPGPQRLLESLRVHLGLARRDGRADLVLERLEVVLRHEVDELEALVLELARLHHAEGVRSVAHVTAGWALWHRRHPDLDVALLGPIGDLGHIALDPVLHHHAAGDDPTRLAARDTLLVGRFGDRLVFVVHIGEELDRLERLLLAEQCVLQLLVEDVAAPRPDEHVHPVEARAERVGAEDLAGALAFGVLGGEVAHRLPRPLAVFLEVVRCWLVRLLEQRPVEDVDRRARVEGDAEPPAAVRELEVLHRTGPQIRRLDRRVLHVVVEGHERVLAGDAREPLRVDVGDVGRGVAGDHRQDLHRHLLVLGQQGLVDGDAGLLAEEVVAGWEDLLVLLGAVGDAVDRLQRDALLAGGRRRGRRCAGRRRGLGGRRRGGGLRWFRRGGLRGRRWRGRGRGAARRQ